MNWKKNRMMFWTITAFKFPPLILWGVDIIFTAPRSNFPRHPALWIDENFLKGASVVTSSREHDPFCHQPVGWLVWLGKRMKSCFSPTAIALASSAIVKVSGQNLFWTLYGYLGQIRLGLPKGSVLKGSLKVRWGQWEVFGEIFDEHSPQI